MYPCVRKYAIGVRLKGLSFFLFSAHAFHLYTIRLLIRHAEVRVNVSRVLMRAASTCTMLNYSDNTPGLPLNPIAGEAKVPSSSTLRADWNLSTLIYSYTVYTDIIETISCLFESDYPP